MSLPRHSSPALLASCSTLYRSTNALTLQLVVPSFMRLWPNFFSWLISQVENVLLRALLICILTISGFSAGIAQQQWRALPTPMSGKPVAATVYRHEMYVVFRAATNQYELHRFDGGEWTTMCQFFTSEGAEILALTHYRGELYLAGSFYHLNRQPQTSGIARWTGKQWESVGGGLLEQKPNCAADYREVKTMEVFQDQLFVGGIFNDIGPLKTSALARWDGHQWHTVDDGLGKLSEVHDLATYNNDLLIGGFFYKNTGQDAVHLLKWNGDSLSTFSQAPLNGAVHAINIYNNQLYISGAFTHIGPNPAYRMANWNGENWDGESASNPALRNGPVREMAVFDNKVYTDNGFAKPLIGQNDQWNTTANAQQIEQFVDFNGDLYAIGTFKDTKGKTSHLAKLDNSNNKIVNTTAATGISIYPNPANFFVVVSSTQSTLKSVTLLKVGGAEVLRFDNLISSYKEVNTAKVPSGTYLLQIETQSGIITRPLTVKH
jgi:hypothetical protein